MRNQERKIEKCIKEFVWETSLFDCTSSFLCHFMLLSLSSLSLFPIDVLAECCLQRYIILQWLVFCVMIPWVNGRKNDNLFQFNTSWLTYLGMWYYFRLCVRFSCSGYDLILIKNSHTLNCYSFFKKFLLKKKLTQTFCW